MLWKCRTQYVSKFGKLSSGHRNGEVQIFIPIPKKGNAKECSNYHIVAFTSHANKVMLNILPARLQQYINWELEGIQDTFSGFRKGTGTIDQIADIRWIIEKAREFQKNIYFCFIDYTKALTVWITTNWKILQEMGIPNYLTCLLRNLYAGQEATELDMEKQTASKGGKEYVKAVYCHPACLPYMQSISRKMPDWMKHKL